MEDLSKFENTIFNGDVRDAEASMPAEIADCVVTSPPYFGHRTYDNAPNDREIGREATVAEYTENLRQSFRQVYRLLKPAGTLWLNLGDSYDRRTGQLLGAPWRVVLALIDDGWILRSDIIWHKPNAMPSATKDRPTTDHEYLFLLVKQRKYYYDADAIREPHVTFSENSKMKGGRNHFGKRGGTPEQGKFGQQSNLHRGRWDQAFHPKGRNKRTVWAVPLGKCREAHFAVFPPALIEPCILAGSPMGGLVLDPFMGSGTTAMVAKRLQRKYLGLELIGEYVDLAHRRIASVE